MAETIVSPTTPMPSTALVDSKISQPQKPINTILLDSSPLLLNSPSLSTLLANSSSLVSTPSVISEIRDPDTRSRVETLYTPFLVLRTPKPESIKFVRDFARRTGDLIVLSRTDIELLALAYDLECQKNGGDWRLRKVPGQRRVNGAPPGRQTDESANEPTPASTEEEKPVEGVKFEATTTKLQESTVQDTNPEERHVFTSQEVNNPPSSEPSLPGLTINTEAYQESFSDSEGWITPSNIRTHKAKDNASAVSTAQSVKTMQVATITGDFAMQNVLLQMNLNLLSSTTCKRITHLRQTILRCHACFATTKQMDKQFCDRCGKPTLTRVNCSTNANGEIRLHLKANMQWNNKGNVFSIPKPSAGTANQKWKGPKHGGGGKDGWGNQLILAEDQKEFVRAKQDQSREKMRDLMDEDYLPSILTGERSGGRGCVKVGAGRSVNSRKR